MKIRKKKVRKVNKLFILVIVSLILDISVSLYISPLTVKLSYELEDMKTRIKQLKEENDRLRISIGELANKERITTIASEEGLSYNQDSVISLKPFED